MGSRSRLAALSLWIGGFSAVVVTTLQVSAWNQADGSLLGVTGEYYSRWSIFPLILILYGLWGVHRHQESGYGSLGRIGFRATFMGYSMLLVGEILWRVLFPTGHPLSTLGGFLNWLALPVILVGLGVWGVASIKSRTLPMWAAPAPLVIALVWVVVRFPLHDFFLYDMPYWMGSGPVIDTVTAVGLGLLGFALWINSDAYVQPSGRSAAPFSSISRK